MEHQNYSAVILDMTFNGSIFIRRSFMGSQEECKAWADKTVAELKAAYFKEWGKENPHLRSIIIENKWNNI